MNDILQLELSIVSLTKENAELEAKLGTATAWIKRDAELNPGTSSVGISWVEHVYNRNRLLVSLTSLGPLDPTEAAFTVWCEANGFPAVGQSLRIFRGGADWAKERKET